MNNNYVSRVVDLFIPVNKNAEINGREGPLNNPNKPDYPMAAPPSWEDQVQDWAALEGYMGRSKEASWEIIKAQIEAKAAPAESPLTGETAPDAAVSDDMARKRLEDIKAKIQPRLDSANEQAQRLQQMGVTPQGARLMIWIGWSCVTALGWVFSWMLERIVQSGVGVSGTTNSINDVVALFVQSFTMLNIKLRAAFPGYAAMEWLVLGLGILMVLAAVVAYLYAQRLSGQFQSIEAMLDVVSQGGAMPDLKPVGTYELDPEVSKKKSTWLIIATALGLLGFGIILSALQQGYAISIILLGYALATVVVAVMMLIVHFSLRHVDWEKNSYLPAWLFKAMVVMTLGLLGLLLISLVLLPFGTISGFARSLAIFSVGIFLLLGTAALAVGQIQHNLFKNESYWIRVRAQIERRLLKLQQDVEEPRAKAKEKEAERRQRIESEQAKLRREIERMRSIYEEAYNIGKSAHELQEEKLSPFPYQNLLPA